jgi:ankyrin repeat protein
MQSPLRDSLKRVDSQGFNCLYYAVYHGHIKVVKMLKKLNIEYQRDSKGTSCLHVALMKGHLDIVDFLLQKTPKQALLDL